MQTLISFVASLVVSTAVWAAPEGARDTVSDMFPYALDFVRARIALEFDSSARAYYEDYTSAIYDLPGHATNIDKLSSKAYEHFTAFPLVRADKFYVFYGAYPNMQTSLADITPAYAIGQENPALEHYASLTAEARSNDLYLWSPDTPFWYSEYFTRNRHLPFRSYFIVHLAAVDATHTMVEVIEDKPVVKTSNNESVDVHGKLQPYTLQPVAPTTSDREFLLSCMHQFIDRGVPGRHWFSCKTAEELAQPAEPAPVPFTTP